MKKASGEIKIGAKLQIYIQPHGRRGMTFKPKVLQVQANQELRWLGRAYIPRLFDGEHALTIETVGDNQVNFTQSEKFSGLLVPFASSLLRDTEKGF